MFRMFCKMFPRLLVSIASAMLTKQARGTFRKHVTKPSEQVAAPDCRKKTQNFVPSATDTPFGQVPILEYEGTVITQSIAIARFLAKKADLYGKDDVTQAHADMIVDYVTDFNNSE